MRKAERKGTQYTVLHTVKARADKGLRERATFYYPIWWGQAPKIISTFLEGYDFSGKTIVPFSTSSSSGMGSSATDLHVLAEGADWLSGQRFSGGTSRAVMVEWINSLNLNITAE